MVIFHSFLYVYQRVVSMVSSQDCSAQDEDHSDERRADQQAVADRGPGPPEAGRQWYPPVEYHGRYNWYYYGKQA